MWAKAPPSTQFDLRGSNQMIMRGTMVWYFISSIHKIRSKRENVVPPPRSRIVSWFMHFERYAQIINSGELIKNSMWLWNQYFSLFTSTYQVVHCVRSNRRVIQTTFSLICALLPYSSIAHFVSRVFNFGIHCQLISKILES